MVDQLDVPDEDPFLERNEQFKAYNRAVNAIMAAYESIFGEPLSVAGQSSEARFRNCLEQLKTKIKSAAEVQLLSAELDVEQAHPVSLEDIFNFLLDELSDRSKISSADDITPNQFRAAVTKLAKHYGVKGSLVKLDADTFLRQVLDEVFRKSRSNGRINVGANRHFPRLYQWLKEYSDKSDWDGGQGLKIQHRAGRGRLAAFPVDPGKLSVVIDRDWL